MQVSDLVNQYQTNLASGGEISGKAKTNPGVEQLVSTVSKLQKGQVFEGTVNSIKGNQVILGLSSGQNITARLDGSLSLNVGESVFFQVKSNEDSLIQIKPVSIGSMNNPTLLNALNAAGLAVTEDNLNMVNTMMKEQMPIDAKSVGDMARITASIPNADVRTIVTMTKHDLPITREMVNQFENYKMHQGQLLNEVSRLGENIGKLLSGEDVSPREAVRFQEDLLRILSGTEEEILQPAGTQAEGLGRLLGERAMVNIKDIAGGLHLVKNDQVQTQADALKAMVAEQMSGSEGLKTPSLEGDAGERTIISSNGNGMLPEAADGENGLLLSNGNILITEDVSEPNRMMISLHYDPADYPALSVGRALPPEENLKLSETLRNTTTFPMDHPEFFDENGALRPETDTTELLHAFSDYASKSLEHATQLKHLFGEKGYANLVSNLIGDSMTIAPEELKEPHKLDDLYRQIDANMTKLASAASHLTPGTENLITTAAAEIHDNLDFISQVNQMYSYIQIPLQMSGQNATGDLYVYRNKKHTKNEDDEISAFLHFDMEHLGSTDISVKMKQKNVNTKFYMADDGAFELIMNNIHILKENLDNLGYSCTIECENDAKPVDFVSDFLERGVKTSDNISRYSFDVRA